MNPPKVTPADLRNLIVGPNELALIDLREGGIFSKSHLLFAISCPLSRLEIFIKGLVPLKTVKLVLCASAIDSNMTTTGAVRLAKLGYSDVSILEGGIEGWGAYGYELFSGVNVPSKAFGEFIETTYKTPHVQAHDIERMKKDGEDFIILDSRPYSEYHAMNIPGGIDVPGAELAYRIHDLAPNSKTKVVVNCAGRTRSIIGAQSLINAGIPNPIMAVENGTMGWHLAGLKLERGQSRRFGDISPNAHLIALERAEAVRHRFDLKLVDGTNTVVLRVTDHQKAIATDTVIITVGKSSLGATIYFTGSGAKEKMEIVQADGSLQVISPAFKDQDGLITALYAIPGIAGVEINTDGTVDLTYDGSSLILQPHFDVEIKEGGGKYLAGIVQDNGKFYFTNAKGERQQFN